MTLAPLPNISNVEGFVYVSRTTSNGHLVCLPVAPRRILQESLTEVHAILAESESTLEHKDAAFWPVRRALDLRLKVRVAEWVARACTHHKVEGSNPFCRTASRLWNRACSVI